MSKNLKKVTSILFAMVLCLSLSFPVLASSKPVSEIKKTSVSVLEDHVANKTEETPKQEEEVNTESSIETTEQNVPDEIVEQSVKKKNSNTPLYIGAGMSVLVFLGVIVFCKIKGNK